MKYAKRPLSILLSLLLILSLFTIIPATTASAADSDTVSKEVHKWVTGMAVEGNSGFYTFDDLYEKFIFVRVTKGTTFTGWDVVDKQTGDLSLTQMGEHDTYRLTWWDNTQNLDHMAGDWQDTNLSDSHIYLDANDKYGATFSNDAYDWYAYTWETFNLTEHAAVDATCTEAGNIKYYTSGERYFTEDNGTYTQVTQADTVIPATGIHTLTHHAAVTPTYNAGTDTYTDGNIEYWSCDECGKYFSDANGAAEITQQDTVVPYFKYTITDSGEVRLDKYNGTDAVVTIPATIPENYYIEAYRGRTIVTIHAYSFQNNASINNVTIGDNIETIGYHAFYNCPNLETATIGTGLKSIYYESFSNCPSLTSLTCYSMHKLDPYGAPLHEGSDNAVVYAFHDSDFINIAYPAIGIDAHTYIATFNWVGYACNTATIECEECDLDEVTVDATVTSEVTTPATYTQAGVRTYTATAVFNGTTYTETKTEAIDPVKLVKGYSLLLKDEIGMRYYLDVTNDLASGATVEFTWGTGDYQKSATGDLVTTDKYGANYYVDCFVAARCMTDTIHAKFTLGDGTVITDEYSIAEFCADAANLESYGADEKNCLCAMLEYGAAAQAYFNYPSNGLASSYVTSVLSDYQPVSAPDSFVDDTTTIDTADLTSYGIEYYGATLVLGSRTAVRLYFTKAYGAELPDPIVNGREVPWYYNNDNGRYYLQITGISAKDIFNDITVQFGDSAQLIYNVKNYYNSGKVSDIMKKLYVYSYYADRALNP